MSNVNLDWPAWLAGADDLAAVQRAVVREGAIRRVMAETGESREVVAESLDAMEAMDQEAVLELADGNPTTLADALARYIRIMQTWEEPDGRVERDVVLSDLSAILEYPWRDEKALAQDQESADNARGRWNVTPVGPLTRRPMPTVDGIRGHLPMTAEEAEQRRQYAEQMDRYSAQINLPFTDRS